MVAINIFTDKWFEMLEQVNDSIELHLSPNAKAICLNIVIRDDETKDTPQLSPSLSQQISSLKNAQAETNPKTGADDDIAETRLYLFEGYLHKGEHPEAQTSVQLNQSLMRSLLASLEMDDVMHAFINGDILVSGDMSQLMALRMAKVTEEQKTLFRNILERSKL